MWIFGVIEKRGEEKVGMWGGIYCRAFLGVVWPGDITPLSLWHFSLAIYAVSMLMVCFDVYLSVWVCGSGSGSFGVGAQEKERAGRGGGAKERKKERKREGGERCSTYDSK